MKGPGGETPAIESESGDWLAVGIQCVPQADISTLDLRIFKTFVQLVLSREPSFA